MKKEEAIQPADILPDGLDSTQINGQIIRKGTIASFLANLDILNDEKVTTEKKEACFAAMQALAPAVVTIGLHKHVVFKNETVEQLLKDTAKKL